MPPNLMTPTTPTAGMEKLATTPGGRSRTEREQRSGNTLYQELSFQDADALGEMDEGADITGIIFLCILQGDIRILFLDKTKPIHIHFILGSMVHPGEYASSGMNIHYTHILKTHIFTHLLN